LARPPQARRATGRCPRYGQATLRARAQRAGRQAVQAVQRCGYPKARPCRLGVLSAGMGIREVARHGHPMVRAGVVIAAAVLVALLIMTAVSVIVGLLWTLIKIVLLVLLVAGLVHIWSRARASGK